MPPTHWDGARDGADDAPARRVAAHRPCPAAAAAHAAGGARSAGGWSPRKRFKASDGEPAPALPVRAAPAAAVHDDLEIIT